MLTPKGRIIALRRIGIDIGTSPLAIFATLVASLSHFKQVIQTADGICSGFSLLFASGQRSNSTCEYSIVFRSLAILMSLICIPSLRLLIGSQFSSLGNFRLFGFALLVFCFHLGRNRFGLSFDQVALKFERVVG